MVRKAEGGDGPDKGAMQVITRAAAVLGALAAPGGGRSLAQLAEHTGLPKTTVHRICTALESVGYMATAAMWLLLVELSREHAEAASPGAPHFQTLSALLAGPLPGYLTAIVFSLGSLMFYYLFYQSRLIPRWLSVWGLVGAVLYLAWPLLALFGHGFGLLMLPLAVAEIVLAVWLIVRGLDSPAPTGTPA